MKVVELTRVRRGGFEEGYGTRRKKSRSSLDDLPFKIGVPF